jgi:small subunit ribosomal protein S18
MERNSSDSRDKGMGRGASQQQQDDGGREEKGMRKTYRSKFRPDYPADFDFDYKDPVTLGRFIMESGKIVPSRISKLSASQQKNVAAAIRKARSLALLPNVTEAYDTFERPETISAKPFSID